MQLEQKPGTQPQESSRAFVLSSSCRDRTASRPTWHRLRRSSRNQGIPCCLRCDSEFVLKKAGPWPGAWDSAAGKAHSGTVSALGKVEIISSHLRLSGKWVSVFYRGCYCEGPMVFSVKIEINRSSSIGLSVACSHRETQPLRSRNSDTARRGSCP